MEEGRFCEHIILLAHAPLRVYDKSGNRKKVYVDCGEQIDILEEDIDFEKFLLQKKRSDSPILYIEQENIAYGIIAGKDSDYVLGPCCTSGKPSLAIPALLAKHKIKEGMPYRIGFVPLHEYSVLVVMLYEMVTGQIFNHNKLMIMSFADEKMENSIKKHRHEVFYERQEDAVLHNPYSQELREQESIKRGDLESLCKSFQEVYVGKIGRIARDEIRNQKDIAIAVIAVSCRSAIQGGVLPEIAFSISDAYIRQVEDAKTEGEAAAVLRKAEIFFARWCRSSIVKNRGQSLRDVKNLY